MEGLSSTMWVMEERRYVLWSSGKGDGGGGVGGMLKEEIVKRLCK